MKAWAFFILALLCVNASPLLAQAVDDKPSEAKTQEKQTQETKPKPATTTTADINIPVDYLELLLGPLTKEELLVEVEGWRDLLKATAQKIAVQEIATRKKTAAIDKADDAGADNKTEKYQDQKDQIMEGLTELRHNKATLLSRLDVVLTAYEAKGGNTEDLRKYTKAVAGITVEVSDGAAFWSAFKGWAVSAEGGVKWLVKLLQLLAVLLVFWGIAYMVGAVVRRMTESNTNMSAMLKSFLNTFARRIVLFIGLLVALSSLGVNVSAVLALLGGGAFILGFALQDTLGNFAAGLMLLFYRPFDEGDFVEVGGVTGTVNNVSLVTTTIRTLDNKVVLVPNKSVWGQVITNSTASPVRRVDMVFGIGYGDDADLAQQVLNDILEQHELVLAKPEPMVELHTLGESSVDFICRPWVKTDDYWRVYWDVTKQVKKAFDAQGISIPFPQRDIHIYQTRGDAKPTDEQAQEPPALITSTM